MTDPTPPVSGSGSGSGWPLSRLFALFYGGLLLAALVSPRALDNWFSNLAPGPIPDLAYRILSPLEGLNRQLGLSAAQDWLADAFRTLTT